MILKLDINAMAEDFFENTRLLGIVAPMQAYRFCWLLNNILRFNFRSNPDVEIPLSRKGREYYFSIFEYNEPNSSLFHYLYGNQFDGEYLLPELKHLDFLWLMKGDWVDDVRLEDFKSSIKEIDGVLMVVELFPDQIKNKGHLIF